MIPTTRFARVKTATFLFAVALLLALGAAALPISPRIAKAQIDLSASASAQKPNNVQVGSSYHNDVSPPLHDLARDWSRLNKGKETKARSANQIPSTPLQDASQSQSSSGLLGLLIPETMPPPLLSFDGLAFPALCSCLPPDASGEVGATQYVQVVAETYQVFDKATGATLLGPTSIESIWNGFGGACETGGTGDPIILYDQLADRWVISQSGGAGVITDQCIAISTSSNATGTWNRYGFHLGSNFFAYPRLSVWPDGYYLSVNVSNASGTTYLGPQPFAFERSKMLAGMPATFVTTGITIGPAEASYLPADFDGSTLPPSGAPIPYLEFPAHGTYRLFQFHADFTTPANSTFMLAGTRPVAAFTQLCPGTRNCIPQLGTTTMLDGEGNRLMSRLAYRNLGTQATPNDALVGNFSVESSGVAGVRWFELTNVTSGELQVVQESTYQPDTTWRWLGSAAMDRAGNLAIGFSASSAEIFPQIRYAGRLATDPPNTLAQGEAHLFDGTGSQTSASDWGPYSDLTIDPVDDCTFWYTNEYYATTGTAWRTRIGNFKFAQCLGSPSPTPTPASPTPTGTPPPELGIFKADSPDPVEVGQELTYTLTVTNHSGFPAFPNIRDVLPASVDFVSVTPSQGTCTGTSTIECDPGGLQAFGSATITVVVRPTKVGQLKNTAVVLNPDPNPENNSSTAVTTVNEASAPTPTPTPTLTPTSTPTPSSTPAAQPLNLSTRMRVLTDDDVGIGGFIITGTDPKLVFVRGIGPSLGGFGVPDPLADPILELHGPPGFVTIINDNWLPPPPPMPPPCDSSGLPPTNDLEPGICVSLDPGAYTAILRGNNNGTGVALLEVYDLDSSAASKLGNLSTRAFVGTGTEIMIAGFILGGNSGTDNVIVRGIGPSLGQFGVPNALADPTLELRDGNGMLIRMNNNWQDDQTQAALINAAGLALTNNLESGIAATLPPGTYTALLAGLNNGTGAGLVEVYDLGAPPP